MNNKIFLIIGLIVVSIIILLSFFINLVFSGLVGVAAGLIAYFILSQNIDKEKGSKTSPENEPEPKNESEQSIESLLNINITLRKSIMPVNMRDSFEEIIDQLIELLPKINEASPEGELAWVINRMATEYLPEKSIKPYLSLSGEERHDQTTIDKVIESLSGMKSELDDVKDILKQRKTNEFNTKAKFLKQRFNV